VPGSTPATVTFTATTAGLNSATTTAVSIKVQS
jgi:hypothetical protein